MYKVVETDKEIIWNSLLHPLITLADEYGGRAQIVNDDHCLVLLLKDPEKHNEDNDSYPAYYKPTYWWFKEAIGAILEADLPFSFPSMATSIPRVVKSSKFPNPKRRK